MEKTKKTPRSSLSSPARWRWASSSSASLAAGPLWTSSPCRAPCFWAPPGAQAPKLGRRAEALVEVKHPNLGEAVANAGKLQPIWSNLCFGDVLLQYRLLFKMSEALVGVIHASSEMKKTITNLKSDCGVVPFAGKFDRVCSTAEIFRSRLTLQNLCPESQPILDNYPVGLVRCLYPHFRKWRHQRRLKVILVPKIDPGRSFTNIYYQDTKILSRRLKYTTNFICDCQDDYQRIILDH